MALLPANDKTTGAGRWAEMLSSRREEFGLTSQELLDLFDDVDSWVDNNAASYNLGIRGNIRNKLTAAQKAEALQIVVELRYKAGV